MTTINGLSVGSMFTFNLTEHPVWVTIYDLAKTQHLDYGFMDPASAGTIPGNLEYGGPKAPFSMRDWSSTGYFPPGIYHARGEVKDANGNTIFDTEIELGPSALYFAYLTGNDSGYFWVEGLPAPLTMPL
jgi:hypothetical protein